MNLRRQFESMLDELLSPKEVSEKLKVSKRQVYRWIKTKELKIIKLGRSVYRITETDLQAFLKKRRTNNS